MPGALPPFYRTPVEVREQIFELCWRDPEGSFKGRSIRRFHGYLRFITLVLSQVCNDWRVIVLRMSHLWSSMNVVLTTDGVYPAPDMIGLWLKRSHNYPLSLLISDDNESAKREYDHETRASEPLNSVIRQYHPHIQRWKYFELQSELPWSPPADLPTLGADSLQRIEIGNVSGHRGGWFTHLFNSAPRLRHFYWLPTGHSLYIPSNVPWSQLTELRMTYPYGIFDFLEILGSCTQLVVCSFEGQVYPTTIAPASGLNTHVLPRLTTLHILFWSTSCLGYLLGSVTLPALKTFHFRGGEKNGGDWPAAQFTSFIHRSNCSIKHLDLHNTFLSENDFVESLRSPLVELRLYNRRICITDRILDMLTYKGSMDGYSTPDLGSIEIDASCISATEGVIATMVESRVLLDPPRILEYFNFRFSAISELKYDDDVKRLAILRELAE